MCVYEWVACVIACVCTAAVYTNLLTVTLPVTHLRNLSATKADVCLLIMTGADCGVCVTVSRLLAFFFEAACAWVTFRDCECGCAERRREGAGHFGPTSAFIMADHAPLAPPPPAKKFASTKYRTFIHLQDKPHADMRDGTRSGMCR